jgi:S1-C subfamily serine protease
VDGAGELPVLEVCAEVGMDCAPDTVQVYQRGFATDGPLRVGTAVASVDAGSAAERAGLRPGDVMAEFSIRRDPAVEAELVVTRGGC